MKVNQVYLVFQRFRDWHCGRGPFADVAYFLGAEVDKLSEVMIQNHVMQADGKPNTEFPRDEAFSVLLLYLAMRGKISDD